MLLKKMKKILIAILFLLTIVNLAAQGLTNKNLWNSIGTDYALEFRTDTLRNNSSVLIDPFNLELLSPSSGVQFYRDGIVFLSYSKRNEKMLEQHLSFGNIESYYASLRDSVLEKPRLFSRYITWAIRGFLKKRPPHIPIFRKRCWSRLCTAGM